MVVDRLKLEAFVYRFSNLFYFFFEIKEYLKLSAQVFRVLRFILVVVELLKLIYLSYFRLFGVVSARQADKTSLSSLEKKLQEERKVRTSLEAQLAQERNAKKTEDNSLTRSGNNAVSSKYFFFSSSLNQDFLTLGQKKNSKPTFNKKLE